jgi:hypothetical protein
MTNALKELVKKHFNLVDAPIVEETVVEEQLSEEVVEATSEEVVEETLAEETTEETFGEIKTADGELTLTYEGDEIAEGLAIFVITEDGNIPAPDGEHALEGDISISTEGGVIASIISKEVEAENEEEMSEESVEATEEESFEELNDLHEALIKAMAGEFKEQIAGLKEEFTNQINAVKAEFGAQPAAEKTITNNKTSYGRNNSVDVSYNPRDSKKAAQFERLLKRRKNN